MKVHATLSSFLVKALAFDSKGQIVITANTNEDLAHFTFTVSVFNAFWAQIKTK
jgi:hypothetical protein